MKIITNNQPRNLIYGYDLTKKEKAEFNYIETDELDNHRFIRYKGNVHDMEEFMCIDKLVAPHPQREGWENWDGYLSDSFFSGMLLKFSSDYETVIIGTYYA